MGKHGGVVERKHVSIRAVLLGIVILGGIAIGSWWWSLRTLSDPIDQSPVAASGFVVSSPSCGDDAGATVVDLLPISGGQTRAVVDACGFSDGQQLAVEYLASDPTRARLAGTSSAAGPGAVRQWWPIGIGILGVMMAGLLVVLLGDRRRFRSRLGPHDGAARHARAEPSDADLPIATDPTGTTRLDLTVSDPAVPSAAPAVTASRGAVSEGGASRPAKWGRAGPGPSGRHALAEQDDGQSPDARWPLDAGQDGWVPEAGQDGWLLDRRQDGWPRDPDQLSADGQSPAEVSYGGDRQLPPADLTTASFRLDLIFPSTAELAASLQDELFTHRHAQVPGR